MNNKIILEEEAKMKDIPGHMMKFMRKVTKKAMQEVEDESYKKEYKKEVLSKKNPQRVKKTKSKVRKMRKEHVPEDLTPEEQNKLMNERVPRIKERKNYIFIKKRD